MLHTILGKNPATTIVIIDEVNTDNSGIAGEQVSDRKKGTNLMKGIHHLGLAVSDLKGSCLFFCDLLGWKQIRKLFQTKFELTLI